MVDKWKKYNEKSPPPAGSSIDIITDYIPPFEWNITYDCYVEIDGSGITKEVKHGTRFISMNSINLWRKSIASDWRDFSEINPIYAEE